MAIIFIEATVPNSFKTLLSVNMKVANPEAVVRLVIKVAFPIFMITRCKDLTLLPCFATSCWYLLMKKIQLGMPITMINGGINAVSIVISYPNQPRIPNAHMTPMITTNMEIKVARKDRKKRKKIMDVSNMAEMTKTPISSTIFWALSVLIYGIPDILTSSPVCFSNEAIKGINV